MSGLNGLGQMFGKSQAWYDQVNQATTNIAVVLAGVNAVGKDLWDKIYQEVALNGGKFDPFDYVTSSLLEDAKALADLGNLTDQQISTAEQDWMDFAPELDYAKRMIPEISPVVEGDMATVQTNLSKSTLKSPAAVGEQTFVDTVKQRAEALGQGFANFGTYLPWILGGAAALYALPFLSSIFGGRRSRAA